MRSPLGHPWLGLISLGAFVVSFVLIDALTSAEEAGRAFPAVAWGVLRCLGAVSIFGVVLAQRHGRLPDAWKAANTLTLAFLAVHLGIVIEMWGLPETSYKAGPRDVPIIAAFIVSLVTAVSRPGGVPRNDRRGWIAGGLIAVPGFLGLVITSRYSSADPRPFEPDMVVASAIAALFILPYAHEFGSRLNAAGPGPRP